MRVLHERAVATPGGLLLTRGEDEGTAAVGALELAVVFVVAQEGDEAKAFEDGRGADADREDAEGRLGRKGGDRR